MRNKQAICRLCALLLATCLMIGMITPAAYAAGTADISFGQVYGERGEQITIPVKITNNPGIASFRFRIAYNTDALTFVSAYEADLMNAGTLNAAFQPEDGELAVTWFHVENISGDGVLFYLVFEISDSAQGKYPLEVRYLPEDVVNASWSQVDCDVAKGSVTVVEKVNATITFKNWDGSIISSKAYRYGDAITVPGNPTRPADRTYSYTFEGWDREVLAICKGDAIYTAVYKAAYIDYVVQFEDWNGTVLSRKTYHYGDSVAAPSAPSRPEDGTYMYSFAGWDKAVALCTGDTTYTAVYNKTAIVVTSVSITNNPTKRVYLQGQQLDLSGLVVKASYNNGTSKNVTGYTISGYNANKVGDQTVTVSYSGKTATFTVTVESPVPDKITSSVFTVENGWIRKISAGTKVSELVNGINEKQYIKVFIGTKEVSGDKLVGTGMVVKLMDGHTVKASVIVVVTGDTNGDGKITITDMLAVKSHVLKKSTLSGEVAKAADTSKDGGISITDFIQIKAFILGKGTITPN